eukprot:2101248-Rhodomonas_salina.1
MVVGNVAGQMGSNLAFLPILIQPLAGGAAKEPFIDEIIGGGGGHVCAFLERYTAVTCWGSGTHYQLPNAVTSTRGIFVGNDVEGMPTIPAPTFLAVNPNDGTGGVTCMFEMVSRCYGSAYLGPGTDPSMSDYNEGRGFASDFQLLPRPTCVRQPVLDIMGSVQDTMCPVGYAATLLRSSMSMADDHMCAILASGATAGHRLSCWGVFTDGDQRIQGSGFGGEVLHVPVLALEGVAETKSGLKTTCVLLSKNSTLFCLGQPLGKGNLVSVPPSRVDLGSAVNMYDLGDDHACALLESGMVKCWGLNTRLQLGVNDRSNALNPSHNRGYVQLPEENYVLDLACGAFVSCALLDSFSVYCWGAYDFLQAKDTTVNEDSYLPVEVMAMDTVSLVHPISVHAYADTVCCVMSDGDARCWGIVDNSLQSQPVALLQTIKTDDKFADKTLQVIQVAGGQKTSSGSSYYTCALLLDPDSSEHHVACMSNQHADLQHFDFHFLSPDSQEIQPQDRWTEIQSMAVEKNRVCFLVTQKFSSVVSLRCLGDILVKETVQSFTTLTEIQLGVSSVAMPNAACARCAPKVQCAEDEFIARDMCAECQACPLEDAAVCTGTSDPQSCSSINQSRPEDFQGSQSGLQKSICIGEEHTCVILESGLITCWGDPGVDSGLDKGQFGHRIYNYPQAANFLNNDNDVSLPIVQFLDVNGNQLTAREVHCGAWHTCALMEDFRVFCWGSNVFGQVVSDRRITSVPTPIALDFGRGRKVSALHTAQNSTCALLSDTSVVCIGENTQRSLGGIENDKLYLTTDPIALVDNGAVDLVACSNVTCVLFDFGGVKCFGKSELLGTASTDGVFLNLGDLRGHKVTQLACLGAETVAVVLSDNRVFAWGSTELGVLLNVGFPDTSGYVGDVEGEVDGFLQPLELWGETTEEAEIIALSSVIAGGIACMIARTGSDVQMKCWGDNGDGQLGIGHAFFGIAGDQYCCVGIYDGQWGSAIPAVNFVSSYAAGDVVAVAGYKQQMCVVFTDGNVQCSGVLSIPRAESTGKFPTQGTMTNMYLGTPVKTGQVYCTPCVAGGCARDELEQVQCSEHGMQECVACSADGVEGKPLCNGGATRISCDTVGGFFSNDYFSDMFVGGFSHYCGVSRTGGVFCWGGQLPPASTASVVYGVVGSREASVCQTHSTQLPLVSLGSKVRVRSLAAGSYTTCALTQDFRVKCWGYGRFGALGLGSEEHRGSSANGMGDNLPFLSFTNNSRVLQLAYGGRTGCVLLEGGSVECWGDNYRGQAGDVAKEVACALLDDNTVQCWGNPALLG